MVVVSHLFFFLWKKLGRGAAHMSRPSPYLELSISRQLHVAKPAELTKLAEALQKRIEL